MSNPFAQYTGNISAVAGVAGHLLPNMAQNIFKKNVPYQNAKKFIFNPQVRKYFDVSHSLVGKKIRNVVFPFRRDQQVEQLRKPELYIPLVSLMTFILFSAFSQGITNNTNGFNPNIGRKILICIFMTIIQLIAAKCTRFAMSNIQMGILDLTSFMSYRFIGLALSSISYSILKVVGVPYVNTILMVYFVLSESYFYYSELKMYLDERINNSRDLSNSTLTVIHLIISGLLMYML